MEPLSLVEGVAHAVPYWPVKTWVQLRALHVALAGPQPASDRGFDVLAPDRIGRVFLVEIRDFGEQGRREACLVTVALANICQDVLALAHDPLFAVLHPRIQIIPL